jgi:hypothetical protein
VKSPYEVVPLDRARAGSIVTCGLLAAMCSRFSSARFVGACVTIDAPGCRSPEPLVVFSAGAGIGLSDPVACVYPDAVCPDVEGIGHSGETVLPSPHTSGSLQLDAHIGAPVIVGCRVAPCRRATYLHTASAVC